MVSLRYSLARIKPTRCIIVFDGKGGAKSRQKFYPEYKSNRKVKSRLNRNINWEQSPMTEEQSIKMQLSRLLRYLEQLPLTLISIDGIEADDTIAYITKQILTNGKIFIMSTDKDFLQLVNERITVWSPTKKINYTPEKIFEEYNIHAKNLLTYRILEGDKSDNISGIRGAGLKSIIKFIEPITRDDKFNIMDLIKFAHTTDKKIKLIENIKNSELEIKRNYLLMQLENVDISNHNKLHIQEAVRRKIPQLVKYKFSTTFIQDKLWGQIPNLDTWIMEFIRLDKYRNLNGK